MPGQILIYYLANIFFNSIIAFGLSVLVVEFFIMVLTLNKKKMFRTIYFLRMLPFIKIIYDVIFHFNTASWAIANGIDIINRLPNSMALDMGAGYLQPFIPLFYYFDFSIYKNYTVSLADIITQHIGFNYTLGIVLALMTGSLFLILYNFIKMVYSFITTKILLSGSKLSKRVISNELLNKRLLRRKTEVFISPEKGFSPFSFGFIHPKIVIPANFNKKLTAREYEVLIIHEIGHIGLWSILSRYFVLLMKSFFWFIPFIHYYAAKINLTMELSCDNNCSHFNCNSLTLAELLKKAAYYVKSPKLSSATALYSEFSPLLLRVRSLLDISIMNRNKGAGSLLIKTGSSIVVLALSFLIAFFILNSRLGII